MASQIAVGAVEPGCKKVDPILVADKVKRQFGGLVAVDVDHVEIPRGMITALIGPNGAGKTTFFNLLTGFDKPNTGSWSFEGRNLAGLSSYKVARLGMIRCPNAPTTCCWISTGSSPWNACRSTGLASASTPSALPATC